MKTSTNLNGSVRKWKRYPVYRDSGVAWLGRIPATWNVIPVKYIASLKGRLGWQNLRADEYTPEGPFLVTSEHFTDDRIDWERCYHVSHDRYAMAPEIQLRPDDLLMMKDGAAMGKLAYVEAVPAPACLNSHLLLFRPVGNRFINRFLYFVLGSPIFTTYMVQERTGTTFFGISQENIGSFSFAVPPIKEQQDIVGFLNRETARIDALIARKERLTELLHEKRIALISHVVTKGLNSSVPMKASGVEWLGDVPADWTPKKLKYLFRFAKRQNYPDLTVLSVYRDYGVIEKTTRDDNHNRTPEDLTTYQLVNVGDLVINKMKAWQGSLGISSLQGITSPDYVVYKSTNSEHLPYLHHRLRIPSMAATFHCISNGIRPDQWRLEPEKFEQLWLFLPPVEEQKRICEHIDRQIAAIDRLRTKIREAIEKLREYRITLISAAVTGKIDVRQEVES